MSTNRSSDTLTVDGGLRAAAARAIARRLQEALERMESAVSGDSERVCALLGEALDHARSWRMTQAALCAPRAAADEASPESVAYGGGESRLAFAAFRGTVGEPVGEFLLIPFGSVQVDRPAAGGSFEFTRRHAESAQRWFEQIGRKLAIDYEHQSFDRFNTRPDGLRPAAGWIGGLEVRDDGLWAVNVSWTQRAAELLRTAEYRYFSPVIYWTDEDQSDVAALGPVALTNDPAMRGVPALAASRGGPADAPLEVPAEGAEEEPDTVDVGELRERLHAARDEVAALRRRLEHQEADTFVERGMRMGKIVDATALDWRSEYLRSAEAAEERLQRSPVLLPPGRLLERDERGRVKPLTGGREPVGSSVLRRWGVEAADLEAFERAAAEGRVRSSLAAR